MCGIVGIIGNKPVATRLIDGLKRLEYRGYDSAGIATLHEGQVDRRRAKGKIVNLEERYTADPIHGNLGIGHTRWATHGAPNDTNAHPHSTDKVAVVHNGIIENYQDLRAELMGKGHVFETETDTEVIAHLVTYFLNQGDHPIKAASKSFDRLEGAFAIALIFHGHDNLMIGARQGTPLAIGHGDGEMYVGSDAMALAPLTNRLTYLEDGDWVVLTRDSMDIYDREGNEVTRDMKLSSLSGAMIGKGDYRHFMLKEIHEQPEVVAQTLAAMQHPSTGQIALPELPFNPADVPRVTIVACGTAYYAGHVAKTWLEQVARVPVELDIASEFRYREAPMPEGGVALFISQSGETLDTLEALRYAKSQGQHIVSIINAPESSIARESDAVMYTLAGPEIAVASTKATTCQLATLASFTIVMARERGEIDEAKEAELVQALREIPSAMAEMLRNEKQIAKVAHDIAEATYCLYMGRGTSCSIALEGALKLKEVSYITAEGYAAGEMKHGPIALIDDSVPVIVVAPMDQLFEKTISNMQEVMARGAKVLLLSDAEGLEKLEQDCKWLVEVPKVHPFVSAILYALPVQLLAYHVAVTKGTDVDQPRNLAKSVTVE
ncbi:MAG: glutamine--fructose-6-phosphate transaminase (isomerizing) [Alphaproteobacteria bacterium]